MDSENPDAPLSMGDFLFRQGKWSRALKWYEQAQALNPADPGALRGLVMCKITLDRNLNFIPLIRHNLENGIATCHDRMAARVYMPHGHYDTGFFHFLLDHPHESLSAYLKAVTLTENRELLGRVQGQIREIRERLVSSGLSKERGDHLDWICRLLRLAMEGCFKTSVNPPDKGISHGHEIVSKEEIERWPKPILIVAGGCDERVEAKIRGYSGIFTTAFRDFQGTVLSGGTTAGISGMVGDLEAGPNKKIHKVAYLPSMPVWNHIHPGYVCHQSPGFGFSPLEPLLYWRDLIHAGVSPSDIRLLGLNGGRIAAFEYRLALTMGAFVGLVADSGRAAADILNDPDWRDTPNLIRLPTDAETLRCFVQAPPVSKKITPEDREKLAISVHEEYRANLKNHQLEKDPAPEKMA